jgi:uncharacterized membrane protein YeaQ/YmgE (transglycosylase-associated protein family)
MGAEMTLRRGYQVAALFFVGLGLFMIWESRTLKYYTVLGPGAGFLPFWVGAILAGLSVVWLVQVTVGRAIDTPEDFIPTSAGARNIFSILGALVLCVALLKSLGFSLTMLGFLAFLLHALGRQGLFVTVVVSVAGSFGVRYVFEQWLGVFLPKASIPFLTSLGL